MSYSFLDSDIVGLSSKCEEVAELTWEKGQLGMHGLGGIRTVGRAGDTLESIVHQATRHAKYQTSIQNYDQNDQDLKIERSVCASASATFCRENDTTTVMWPSFDESSRSIKSKTTCDEDSACHGGGSRRRDRINQRMKALQRLVPNASKTDKASMLNEVIEYLKQLQAQVQLMNSSARNMAPQMMMPLGMHQHIQMSLLARMGMGVGLGMGMGMFDMTALARAAATTAATTPHHRCRMEAWQHEAERLTNLDSANYHTSRRLQNGASKDPILILLFRVKDFAVKNKRHYSSDADAEAAIEKIEFAAVGKFSPLLQEFLINLK
ncbi:hypothetical protein RND71_029640 [Anisodus tanguticus]|uniref:BHLH domain-containing protein n=1 Tax=Anisodus tanguticus TaxID=243964 RepID=A0AAE1RGP7_9SOLA|nr:hypothetical protein RND71_029640 [Anisodus tanguticus]